MSRTWRDELRHVDAAHRRPGQGHRRPCPVAGCVNRITPSEVMCGQHWYLVPEALKRAGDVEGACRAVEQMTRRT